MCIFGNEKLQICGVKTDDSNSGSRFQTRPSVGCSADLNSEVVGTRFGTTTWTGESFTDFLNSVHRIEWPEKNLNKILLISNAVDVLSFLQERV